MRKYSRIWYGLAIDKCHSQQRTSHSRKVARAGDTSSLSRVALAKASVNEGVESVVAIIVLSARSDNAWHTLSSSCRKSARVRAYELLEKLGQI